MPYQSVLIVHRPDQRIDDLLAPYRLSGCCGHGWWERWRFRRDAKRTIQPPPNIPVGEMTRRYLCDTVVIDTHTSLRRPATMTSQEWMTLIYLLLGHYPEHRVTVVGCQVE